MKRALLTGLCAVAALGFAMLGLWQIERRAWKLDLIARVEARVRGEPVAVPDWSRIGKTDEYRRVRLAGTFLPNRDTLVDALTERGPGFWVIAPLETAQGIVLVNRGFVPPNRAQTYDIPAGAVALTGLLRLTEPEGRIFRPNQPATNRWFSRDVAAIAAARRIAPVAPFFVDAGAGPRGTLPVGGLTVVKFRNTHLVYALTWFALAALAGFGVWKLVSERRDG